MQFCRHRGSRNSSAIDPTLPLVMPRAASAFARRHGSGSRKNNVIGMTSTAGRIPTKNSSRQPE